MPLTRFSQSAEVCVGAAGMNSCNAMFLSVLLFFVVLLFFPVFDMCCSVCVSLCRKMGSFPQIGIATAYAFRDAVFVKSTRDVPMDIFTFHSQKLHLFQ